MEFCFINAPLFKFRPTYKHYFHPFSSLKHQTYYYIADYNQYSLKMLEDDERIQGLAIVYIIVVGLTNEESEKMFSQTNLAHLYETAPYFSASAFPIEEFYNLGTTFNETYGYTFPIDFAQITEMYDIPKNENNEILILGLDVAK